MSTVELDLLSSSSSAQPTLIAVLSCSKTLTELKIESCVENVIVDSNANHVVPSSFTSKSEFKASLYSLAHVIHQQLPFGETKSVQEINEAIESWIQTFDIDPLDKKYAPILSKLSRDWLPLFACFQLYRIKVLRFIPITTYLLKYSDNLEGKPTLPLLNTDNNYVKVGDYKQYIILDHPVDNTTQDRIKTEDLPVELNFIQNTGSKSCYVYWTGHIIPNSNEYWFDDAQLSVDRNELSTYTSLDARIFEQSKPLPISDQITQLELKQTCTSPSPLLSPVLSPRTSLLLFENYSPNKSSSNSNTTQCHNLGSELSISKPLFVEDDCKILIEKEEEIKDDEKPKATISSFQDNFLWEDDWEKLKRLSFQDCTTFVNSPLCENITRMFGTNTFFIHMNRIFKLVDRMYPHVYIKASICLLSEKFTDPKENLLQALLYWCQELNIMFDIFSTQHAFALKIIKLKGIISSNQIIPSSSSSPSHVQPSETENQSMVELSNESNQNVFRYNIQRFETWFTKNLGVQKLFHGKLKYGMSLLQVTSIVCQILQETVDIRIIGLELNLSFQSNSAVSSADLEQVKTEAIKTKIKAPKSFVHTNRMNIIARDKLSVQLYYHPQLFPWQKDILLALVSKGATHTQVLEEEDVLFTSVDYTLFDKPSSASWIYYLIQDQVRFPKGEPLPYHAHGKATLPQPSTTPGDQPVMFFFNPAVSSYHLAGTCGFLFVDKRRSSGAFSSSAIANILCNTAYYQGATFAKEQDNGEFKPYKVDKNTDAVTEPLPTHWVGYHNKRMIGGGSSVQDILQKILEIRVRHNRPSSDSSDLSDIFPKTLAPVNKSIILPSDDMKLYYVPIRFHQLDEPIELSLDMRQHLVMLTTNEADVIWATYLLSFAQSRTKIENAIAHLDHWNTGSTNALKELRPHATCVTSKMLAEALLNNQHLKCKPTSDELKQFFEYSIPNFVELAKMAYRWFFTEELHNAILNTKWATFLLQHYHKKLTTQSIPQKQPKNTITTSSKSPTSSAITVTQLSEEDDMQARFLELITKQEMDLKRKRSLASNHPKKILEEEFKMTKKARKTK